MCVHLLIYNNSLIINLKNVYSSIDQYFIFIDNYLYVSIIKFKKLHRQLFWDVKYYEIKLSA